MQIKFGLAPLRYIFVLLTKSLCDVASVSVSIREIRVRKKGQSVCLRERFGAVGMCPSHLIRPLVCSVVLY